MNKILEKIKGHKILTGIVVLVVVIIIISLTRGSGEKQVETITVKRATLTQEVSVSGKTKPVEDVDLAFERSGRVSRINAQVGDKVYLQQVLVQLDASELSAQKQQAEASVAAQRARLDQLEKGTRPEQIEISKNAVSTAKQNVLNAYDDVANVLQDAYFKSDDAIRKQLDDLFTNDDQSVATLSFDTGSSFAKYSAETARIQATTELNTWKKALDSLSLQMMPSYEDGANWMKANDDALKLSRQDLNLFVSLVNHLMDAVSNAPALSQTTVTTYKTYISSARTSLNLALTALTNQEQAISSAKLALERSERELNLQLAGSTPEEISAQKAALKQAEANLAGIEAQIAKTYLRAPIAGLVTKMDTKAGQIVSPNVPLVSVISAGDLEIETNIPEADIAKISLGDTARVTLDAYGEGVVFTAQVVSIDPTETQIEGVSTYKTTIAFTDKDDRIKPGMTANLDILTENKEGVLVIPQRAILNQDGKKIVKVYKDGSTTPEDREITVGLRGLDSNIEVLSGLSEGEKIAPLVENP